jgi:hypothetical protein
MLKKYPRCGRTAASRIGLNEGDDEMGTAGPEIFDTCRRETFKLRGNRRQ